MAWPPRTFVDYRPERFKMTRPDAETAHRPPARRHRALLSDIWQVDGTVLRDGLASPDSWRAVSVVASLEPQFALAHDEREHLRNPNLTTIVDRALSDTSLPHEHLELEITESSAIKGADYVIPVLHDLKALGVSIAIDDFGIECSSLSRLKQLPIDRIKMAMQFVHGIAISSKDEAIAEVIVHLARTLGLRVIAEGVETQEQLEFLSERMCDEVQGFYCYRPMPAEDIATMLADRDVLEVGPAPH